MTIHIAKSLRHADDQPFIAINSNMEYEWFDSYEDAVNTLHMLPLASDSDDRSLEEWFSNLKTYNMEHIATFTAQTHPELFI